MNSKELIRGLEAIMGKGNVLKDPAALNVYDYDASLFRRLPDAVVFVTTTQQVSQLVRFANGIGAPYLARGSGTNLSGGTVPVNGGIIIDMCRMNRILDFDFKNQTALVEPGLYNLSLNNALAPHGYYYAPDPASEKVCTLGGNVGENSGGPHCLKYGVTSNHVLGAEVVLPNSEIVWFGGNSTDAPGPDLLGLFVGCEGTLGIATKIMVRIMRSPEKVVTMLTMYNSIEEAGQTVSDIIAEGIIPATLEIMDNLVIQAVEDSVKAGYPRDAEAVLIIELDGVADGMDDQAEKILEICHKNNVVTARKAKDGAEREMLWAGRKGAFGAVARLKPNYMVCDGTVPRTELPQALAQVKQISKNYDLPIGNVFHAGDGNLHPLILFDDRNEDELERVHKAGNEIMKVCVDLGGTISGEHGIGTEKRHEMHLIFSEDDLRVMRSIKEAVDPKGLCNPGKIIPQSLPEQMPLSHYPGKGVQTVALNSNLGEKSLAFAELEKTGVVGKRVERPSSESQLQQILGQAYHEGLTVLPLGGGTALGVAGLPEEVDIVLDMTGLANVVTLDTKNLNMTVQAGITLDAINLHLGGKEKGFFLPLDPPLSHRATIGGVYASNLSGPSRLLYGTLRDQALGVSAVDAEGHRLKFGGITVKNVSGYDLTKFFIGSAGSLCIITSISFVIYPLPEASSLCEASLESQEKIQDLLSDLRSSALIPTSVMVLDGASGSGFRLLTAFEGHPKAVERQSKDFIKMAENYGARGKSQMSRHAMMEHLRSAINPDDPENNVLTLKASVPIVQGIPAYTAISQLSKDHGLKTKMTLFAGNGVLYSYTSKDNEETLLSLVDGVKDIAERFGGHVVPVKTPRKILSTWGSRVDAGLNCHMLRPIKDKLDPKHILLPLP